MYGRIVGLICLDIYRASSGSDIPDKYWHWIDPGVMAVIGSASLLGGVTRLTLAVTVIVVSVARLTLVVTVILVAVTRLTQAITVIVVGVTRLTLLSLLMWWKVSTD